MSIYLTVYEPHQIIRTTNNDGTIINAWQVNEDGSVQSVQAALIDRWTDPEATALGDEQ